jgi:hypothetical protein
MMTRDPAIDLELRLATRQEDGRGPQAGTRGWLAELREMRGRVCYDHGRRPSFLRPDGTFIDADPADLHAYHVVARSEGRAIGCSRIVPLTNGQPSTVGATVGEERFAQIVSALGTARERTCEASRWVVVPEHRNGLGPRIVVASWTVARLLGFDIAFVLAGTREGQDRALMRMGARPVENLGTFSSDAFDDDLRLLFFDVPHPSDFMEHHMRDMMKVLKLDALPYFNHALIPAA